MSKREKLIDKLTNNPQTATCADIRNLLEYEGFYLDAVTDSHHVYIYAETILVIPIGNNKVKIIYIEKILESIEAADSELEDDD